VENLPAAIDYKEHMQCLEESRRLVQGFESPDPQRPTAIIRERQIWGHTVYPKLGDSVI